jgi:hypothetical protein
MVPLLDAFFEQVVRSVQLREAGLTGFETHDKQVAVFLLQAEQARTAFSLQLMNSCMRDPGCSATARDLHP